MKCDFVTEHLLIERYISARTKEEFISQFKELLSLTKAHKGVVYIWLAENPIPRLKGESPVIYIGKTLGNFHNRYISKITNETNEYWGRYEYIISTFGKISIEIYKTENPNKTENNFLFQYHQKHLELPPLNLRSYQSKMLEQYS